MVTVIMPTSRESICFCEVERVVMKKEENASKISCITNHEGFGSVCLNVWVLQIAYYNYRYHYSDAEEKDIHEKVTTDACAILFFNKSLFP